MFTKRTEYIAMSIFLLSNCAIIYVAFIINSDIFPSLQDSPIYLAFKDPMLIYFGITVNVATCTAASLWKPDVLVSFFHHHHHHHHHHHIKKVKKVKSNLSLGCCCANNL